MEIQHQHSKGGFLFPAKTEKQRLSYPHPRHTYTLERKNGTDKIHDSSSRHWTLRNKVIPYK